MTDDELAELVAARIATVLGYPADPPVPRVAQAASAAVALVRWFIYGEPIDPPPPVPAGEDALAGLTALGVRIYHDPASPGGVIGGDAFTGAAIPEDLLAHVRHYFAGHRTSWGMA